jgi:hypothetical protein
MRNSKGNARALYLQLSARGVPWNLDGFQCSSPPPWALSLVRLHELIEHNRTELGDIITNSGDPDIKAIREEDPSSDVQGIP